MTTLALSGILLFGILAFGATERWALSAMQVAIFVLGGVQAWRLRSFPAGAIPLALIPAWGALQVAAGASVYAHQTLAAGLNWGAWLALFVAASGILAEEEARRRFRLGMICAGAALSLEALAQHVTAPGLIYWTFPTRAGFCFGPFPNPDHYAALMEILIPAALWEAMRGRRHSAAAAGAAALMFASIVASGSRAGVVLGGLEMLALPLLLWRRFPVGRRVAAAMAVFTVAATLTVGWQFAWQRFQLDDPWRYRREMAASTLEMIRDRPLTGFGLGTFETVYPAYASFDIGQRVTHAHNDWVEWTAEGGLPALLLLGALTGWNLWRNRREAWTWGAYVVLAHGLVDFPGQIPGVAAVVIVLMSL